MRFGVSTHLYHDRRLQRDHLAQVAAYGFEAIELFATRSHFDYRDEAAIDLLKQWLAETGLTLNSVHAPITDLFRTGDRWSPTYSNAVNDRKRREAAVRETDIALKLAERIFTGREGDLGAGGAVVPDHVVAVRQHPSGGKP